MRRDDVVQKLQANGQSRAARWVSRLKANDGLLDEATCDAILLRAHAELQRLNEEFLQVDRVRTLLVPMLKALRGLNVPGPYRHC
ncbi:MAG: hypothetical protein K1X64_04940 [Myxococcaceae bacterium]|nr:hypothetical protein [Myxococcaceae bacterium]